MSKCKHDYGNWTTTEEHYTDLSGGIMNKNSEFASQKVIIQVRVCKKCNFKEYNKQVLSFVK